ncbi:stage 0 sporulation regulatory protein [Natronobacillus azotifigens]|uniref:Aspartyl-phosphate phosphatase Spo0E family protein n=1 Tax=Natronobacillus azotifigens TaxID=472978 RepID=A0A9J6REX6_9BACI|nr:aspartyl-phosphate phosphatase Spo0E family protein [Natronobacillus azotifigens]MCZ0703950.1 aspartyl-phosphate phosphatase Spo0E family protein [Natronobacillus azotifigens]
MTSEKAHYLLIEIEQLRQKLVNIVRISGFTSEESIIISQELDILLNEFEEIERNK